MIKSLLNRVAHPLAITAIAATVATSAQAGTLSIGHTTWVGYGTLYLAQDLGYFKEGGLTVELPVVEEASMYMAAQASGELSGSASTIDEVLKYRPQFCFKAVAALDDSHGGDGVLVGKDVKSLQELKGKAVAVNEGSTSQFWLSYLLKKHGMTMSDITVQNMTADDAATAFIAGRVPAAVTWEPHLSMVRNKQQGKVLIDSSSTPGVIVDVVALNCTGRRQGLGRRSLQSRAVHQGSSARSLQNHGQRRRRLPRRSEGTGSRRARRALLRSGHERKTPRFSGQAGRQRAADQTGQRNRQ
jgi:NitT/TauT family transport system substrate-binding protein